MCTHQERPREEARTRALTPAFSIGWNQTESFRDEILHPYHSVVRELYFGLPDAWEPEVREHFGHLAVEEYLEELRMIRAHFKEITLTVLLNRSCLGSRTSAIDLDHLGRRLREIEGMIDSVAVSNLLLAEYILREFPEKRLSLSVRLGVDTFEQVRVLVEKYGVERIWCLNIGRNAVYSFSLLERIRKLYPTIRLKVIVNEFCARRCLDSDLHSNMKAHNAYASIERFTCATYDKSTWWRFFTGMGVLPRDVHHWIGLVDFLKISSRWLSTECIKFILDCYLHQANVTLGDVVHRLGQGGCWFRTSSELCNEIDMTKTYPVDYFVKRSQCNYDCVSCKYCETIASEFIRRRELCR
jgi:hypothetical protein